MVGKRGETKVPPNGDSRNDDELLRLKAEYEQFVDKNSKEANNSTWKPDQKSSTADSSEQDAEDADRETEEISVVENWMRFLKVNAEWLVLYGLLEVTNIRSIDPFASRDS